MRFFPGSGHLLLSASMDTTVKIWDVGGDRRCMRTYMGHSAAVREVNFDGAGARFASTSFDKTVKVWDTETGKCVANLGNGKVRVRVHVCACVRAERVRVRRWRVARFRPCRAPCLPVRALPAPFARSRSASALHTGRRHRRAARR